MAQKTNLNISPYYDDFRSQNNFYKVLFNPGRPIQARELTTLQSILQDQIEKFAQRMIKYWEKEENYEICAEIIKLKKKMISKWKKVMAEETNEGEEIKEWLKSSL